MALLTTHLAAASAIQVWMGIELVKFGKPSLLDYVAGTIAGIASIAPVSGYIKPLA